MDGDLVRPEQDHPGLSSGVSSDLSRAAYFALRFGLGVLPLGRPGSAWVEMHCCWRLMGVDPLGAIPIYGVLFAKPG